jgi:hypothetical protein
MWRQKMADEMCNQEMRARALELAVSLMKPPDSINEKQGVEVIEHYFPLIHTVYEFLHKRDMFDDLCKKQGLPLLI